MLLDAIAHPIPVSGTGWYLFAGAMVLVAALLGVTLWITLSHFRNTDPSREQQRDL